MNCKACLRLSRRTAVEDTDGSSEESDDSWEWYEDREFDSLFFSPGQLRPRTEHPDAAADEPAPGFLERRSRAGQTHCWDYADSSNIPVRGPNYLADSVKELSSPPMLELLSVLMSASRGAAPNELSRAASAVHRARQDDGETRFLLFLNFELGNVQLSFAFAAFEEANWTDTPAGRLFESFCNRMSDAERGARLKLLPKVLDGPWVISASVPSKPTIISRQCPTTFCKGLDYLQASVDCSSSSLGKKLSKVVGGGQCELALFVVLEGQVEDELPERILGAASLFHTDASRVVGAG